MLQHLHIIQSVNCWLYLSYWLSSTVCSTVPLIESEIETFHFSWKDSDGIHLEKLELPSIGLKVVIIILVPMPAQFRQIIS